jgi:hypothetical protein
MHAIAYPYRALIQEHRTEGPNPSKDELLGLNPQQKFVLN